MLGECIEKKPRIISKPVNPVSMIQEELEQMKINRIKKIEEDEEKEKERVSNIQGFWDLVSRSLNITDFIRLFFNNLWVVFVPYK